VLELLYASFRGRHLAAGTARAARFAAFQAQGGEPLRRHALFEALQERFAADEPPRHGWMQWPPAYRDPASAEVAAFAAMHASRVHFHEYLQWQVDEQLAAAAARVSAAGARVGLYLDLAVSVDRGGSDAWSDPALYAPASVGAPPDDFAPQGQDWGLPPMRPDVLLAARYAPFVATLRANMAHAGALRIDHVMALARLFWIPPGGKPADGTYVRYPLDALLGIVALESRRNRCIVIGEDLGTVPDDVRAGLARYGILSYRLLPFEREGDGAFRPPARWPRDALAACATHDLPTLAGWWAGRDIEVRASLGLIDAEERLRQAAQRAADRERLVAALVEAGYAPPGAAADAPFDAALAIALQAYVASGAARIMVVQLEDAMGVVEQANLPGTVHEHPNWRRRLPGTLEEFADDPRFARLAEALRAARG
jgi:(1->4)-alpha-D-glucan 1-alpha-D-glucosylmutase